MYITNRQGMCAIGYLDGMRHFTSGHFVVQIVYMCSCQSSGMYFRISVQSLIPGQAFRANETLLVSESCDSTLFRPSIVPRVR